MSTTTIAVLLGVAAAVVAVSAGVGGAKAGRATERGMQRAARTGSITGRALRDHAVILAVQWLVVRATTDPSRSPRSSRCRRWSPGSCVARVLAGPDVVRVSRRSLR